MSSQESDSKNRPSQGTDDFDKAVEYHENMEQLVDAFYEGEEKFGEVFDRLFPETAKATPVKEPPKPSRREKP